MILQVQRLPLRFRPSLSSLLVVYIQELQRHYSSTGRRRRRRRGTEQFSFFSTDVGNNLRVLTLKNFEDANCKGQRGRPQLSLSTGPA